MKFFGYMLLVSFAADVFSSAAQRGRQENPETKCFFCRFANDSCIAGTLRIVRTIDDPGTGIRWRIEPDSQHPSGPGRMIRVTNAENPSGAHTNLRKRQRHQVLPSPQIRVGDAVVVIEETSVSEARLEGIALGDASSGEPIRVQLKSTGSFLEAIAVTNGYVRLSSQSAQVCR